MRCKHPLVRHYEGVNPITGELKYRVLNCDKSRAILYGSTLGELDQLIPCGHCIACKINKSSEWATRMMMEVKTQPENSCWFLTLTYDNEHLPPNKYGFSLDDAFLVDDKLYYNDILNRTREWHPTLEKQRISWFMKNLRNLVHYDAEKYGFPEPKIRFYGCGEYGDKNRRPHYHIILFGLPLDVIDKWPDGQLVVSDKSKLNYPLYTSQIIERAWSYEKVPLGLHRVAPVSWETCAYTARYVQKKLSGEIASTFYYDQGIIPEYSVMSRKPGIGREYFDMNKDDLFKQREIILSTSTGGKKLPLPGYYDDLFDIDPDYMIASAARKTKLKSIMKANDEHQSQNTSANLLEQLEIEEDNLKAKLKVLRRDGF